MSNNTANSKSARKGVTTVQWCVVVAIITLGAIAAVRTLGTGSSTRINTMASDVANPANLPSRFGS